MDEKNKYTKNHYVPCCYLAQFGISPEKQRQSEVYAFDREKLSILPRKMTVESVAFANNFYDIDDADPKIVEKMYTDIEHGFIQLMKKVLSKLPKNTITLKEKEALSAHLAIQYFRTPEFRKIYAEPIGELCNITGIENAKSEIKALAQEVHIKEIASFRGAITLANVLYDGIWVIWYNATEVPFYTSDNPVARIYHGKAPHFGILDPELEFYFPLTPKLAVSIYRQSESLIVHDRDVIGIKDVRPIDSFNIHLLENCSRFVFSNTNEFQSYQIQQNGQGV